MFAGHGCLLSLYVASASFPRLQSVRSQVHEHSTGHQVSACSYSKTGSVMASATACRNAAHHWPYRGPVCCLTCTMTMSCSKSTRNMHPLSEPWPIVRGLRIRSSVRVDSDEAPGFRCFIQWLPIPSCSVIVG